MRASPAAGPNGTFTTGAGHDWWFDEAGIGWHTGSGGIAAFDDTRGANEPNLAKGNIALVTEEDYFNEGDEIDCSQAGLFQTWYVPNLDGSDVPADAADAEPGTGSIRNLDAINPPLGRASRPACSARPTGSTTTRPGSSPRPSTREGSTSSTSATPRTCRPTGTPTAGRRRSGTPTGSPAATEDYLTRHAAEIETAILVGGPVAIAEAVRDQVLAAIRE